MLSTVRVCLRTKALCFTTSKVRRCCCSFRRMCCGFVTRLLFSGSIFFSRYFCFLKPTSSHEMLCRLIEEYGIAIKPLACSFAVAASAIPGVLEIALPVVLVQGSEVGHTTSYLPCSCASCRRCSLCISPEHAAHYMNIGSFALKREA